ncbi:hypothetical protein [Paremcibacter congregatus]|uniref:hypothetical protein n=1 Tax=Paremcibacter congregatus TaxID=2043170 RepID=UPI0030EB392C
MARGHLKWSVRELATKAGLGISTIQRMEAVDDVPVVSTKNLTLVQLALEAAGIEFIPENGGGAGVRVGSR